MPQLIFIFFIYFFYHEVITFGLPSTCSLLTNLSQTNSCYWYLHSVHWWGWYWSLLILYCCLLCQVCRNVWRSSCTHLLLQHSSWNRCPFAKNQWSPLPWRRWVNWFHPKMDPKCSIHPRMGHERKRRRKSFPHLGRLSRIWNIGSHHFRFNQQHDRPFKSQRINQCS